MFRRLVLPALLLITGIAVWGVIALNSGQKSSEKSGEPPLTGWMQNFVPSKIPQPVPSFDMLAEDGKRIFLADFQGKLVLINFWATWCLPCIREMPTLVALQNARGGDQFTVLALSQDLEGWEKVSPFRKRLSLESLNVLVDENTRISQAFNLIGLPTTILMSRDGKEIGRLTGIAEWDSAEALALIDYYLAR
jgi:thiol-disulfide isomerase/thioredoxin